MRVGEFFRGSTRARPMGRWVWVLATLGVFVTVATVGVTPAIAVGAPHRGDEFGPGCAPDRPAVAHYAGGVIATGHHGPAPIPCMTATGFRTSEISLVVTNKGTLLFEPALATESPGLPIGVLRSTDQGASWKFINPATTGSTSPRTDGTDENMWVDRETGRVFWSSEHFGMPLGDVDHSNTDGQSWSTSASTGLNVDHTQIFSGPPVRSMRNSLHGYPDVIYLTTSRGGAYTTRSMDGGQTWAPPVPISYPADCPFPGSDPAGGYGLDGVVGKDGTIYLPFTPCEEPYVAISHDEGTTWQLVRVANTETIGIGELGLGMDKAGNLYTAWTAAADRLPYLSVSRDHGLHWSTPLMIGAPGVNEAAEPQLVVGITGQVAVTYYGSTNSPGKPFPPLCLTGTIGAPPQVFSTETASLGCPAYVSETWNTYITESFNALDRKPLFWSATLNNPSEPTWYGVTPSAIRVPGKPIAAGADALAALTGPSLGGHVDYYSMTMAPNETPWVGFFQECPFGRPVAGNPNCPSTLNGSDTDGLFGMVGRLVRVAGPSGS